MFLCIYLVNNSSFLYNIVFTFLRRFLLPFLLFYLLSGFFKIRSVYFLLFLYYQLICFFSPFFFYFSTFWPFVYYEIPLDIFLSTSVKQYFMYRSFIQLSEFPWPEDFPPQNWPWNISPQQIPPGLRFGNFLGGNFPRGNFLGTVNFYLYFLPKCYICWIWTQIKEVVAKRCSIKELFWDIIKFVVEHLHWGHF